MYNVFNERFQMKGADNSLKLPDPWMLAERVGQLYGVTARL